MSWATLAGLLFTVQIYWGSLGKDRQVVLRYFLFVTLFLKDQGVCQLKK